ncbi:diguanylate cyclase [Hyphomicrobium nitrativorans NL23]|uniref:Diguanylate cyclase n=1 Tax=Hyphomicrobium nitrativorans NL23 TaxID=1029756 RepID=V5SEM2_9HYPH|nr:EAL domain-containing protein [Hyphomicrobium nitrativorans]AHB48978.1 diguanylate cyclase [Hyphomicrobium nitrativorans NL23]
MLQFSLSTPRASAHAEEASDRAPTETVVNLANAVFNCSQEAIVVTDTEGMVIAVNPAFTTISGYSALEVVGRSMRSLQSGRHRRAFYRELWAHVAEHGYWQGEIWNKRKNGKIYPALLTLSSVRDANGRVTHFIGSTADLSRIKKSELELDHAAHHDDLTGLPNRRLLITHLDRALHRAVRQGAMGAVLFIDLDRFKLVNDSLGHGAGDELLRLATRRLRESLRSNDLLARFGGDEFIVLLEQTSPEGAGIVAQHVIDRLTEPFLLPAGEEIYIGASIGISFFPNDSSRADELLQHADAALYQAKSAGRSTYRVYSSDLTAVANTRLTMEAQLRRALERDEFVLHYQPLVSLTTGRVFGLEALIRWQDPERGLISPADFLPVAEETGLIVPIGNRMLKVAAAQMKMWRHSGLALDLMAVNISPRQFRHLDFAGNLAATLRETRLSPELLELEITEETLMDSLAATRTTLAALKSLGVGLAVDDFGTGYSSLAYLKTLPCDTLKIDRSFVTDLGQDPASEAIVTAIIRLAECLGLSVLAEGIETQQQRDILAASGCHMGQGFLFARAVPAHEVPSLPGLGRVP